MRRLYNELGVFRAREVRRVPLGEERSRLREEKRWIAKHAAKQLRPCLLELRTADPLLPHLMGDRLNLQVDV